MVRRVKCQLIKLHIEIEGASRFFAKLLYSDIITNIVKSFKVDDTLNKVYPVSINKLCSLIKLVKVNKAYFIGIVPDNLSVDDYQLYKQILSVEYGVYGKECRVIRKVLELVSYKLIRR